LLWFFISQEQLSLQGSCFWAGACCFESFSEATLPRFWWSLSQVCHPRSPFKSPLLSPPLSVTTLTVLREKGWWNLVSSCFLLRGGDVGPWGVRVGHEGDHQDAAVVGGVFSHQNL
jgi:hypothetical protein